MIHNRSNIHNRYQQNHKNLHNHHQQNSEINYNNHDNKFILNNNPLKIKIIEWNKTGDALRLELHNDRPSSVRSMYMLINGQQVNNDVMIGYLTNSDTIIVNKDGMIVNYNFRTNKIKNDNENIRLVSDTLTIKKSMTETGGKKKNINITKKNKKILHKRRQMKTIKNVNNINTRKGLKKRRKIPILKKNMGAIIK